ncbi:MAG: DUF721 domain-containing protein [Actinobacteria bacterium]|nr:DUF721 domain-containing protein [Actinomycetota bacterium]
MPWSPLPTPDGDQGPPPTPLREGLDAVLRSLGGGGVDAIVLVHERWSELVGPEVADRSRPISVRDGCLSVRVAGPAWADHLRWSEAEILGRVDQLLGPGTIVSLSVRIDRHGGR